jgi:PAS domain S-box-containing protein
MSINNESHGEAGPSPEVLRALVTHCVEGIVITDAQQRVNYMNPAAEQLFGYSVARLRGQSIEQLLPQCCRDDHQGLVAAFAGEQSRANGGVEIVFPD